ncbi:hypothetical protein LOTGIDRAFT_159710 [Lottia gigantea]|uniref:Uncharacterized protein n=1 Tax=Lottia gigantea TaxID=225164 RepID=V3ZZI8_LOTGI|nr:hypothetical protein LOTGIDRAFT_159710 [Lottia gigantea]ESO96958.1 hypothetical protein LOTGIDRAFT_159710 [Lottia gigantea]
MGSRKKTRRYEASRRNGHYTPTQQTPTSSSSDKHPPSITKARRRLQFGRKPPKDRGIPATVSDSDNTDEKIESKPSTDKEIRLNVPNKEPVQTTPSNTKPPPINTKRQNSGVRLKKELEFLLDDADHVVYPVRLRSTLHSLMNCNRNRKEDVTTSNKSQKVIELSPPPSSSRQH